MIDPNKRASEAEAKEKIVRRYQNRVEPDVIYPAKKQVDFYDDNAELRVAAYVRVSTDTVQQTTSYVLQKRHYEEYVAKHSKWTLVGIYADEGISGTSTAHRIELNRMMMDCRAGKIDLIITKSVSRLARNVVDCITMVRNLAELSHPVGVFFESECIFSLNQDSQMPLSFLATIAEEESHIRSRSMEVSLSQRLNGGLPLTPKLLGYSHDADGNLIVNPEEAPTVKLIFYMYLYGYSSAEIADTLEMLGRKTYLGNIKWSAGAIIQILRNERHCGYVLTRKTCTPNFRTHRSVKNRGDRVQALYKNHHEPIVSRDDFIAVQHLIDNAKYGNKSILPELRVIDTGLLKGFVTISPKWAGFKAVDYFQASISVYREEELQHEQSNEDADSVELEPGDFDLRGFEVSRLALFDSNQRPYVVLQQKELKFNSASVRKYARGDRVELLIHPTNKLLAVKAAPKDSRHYVTWARPKGGQLFGKEIPCAAFGATLFELLGWSTGCKYRAYGTLIERDGESVMLFDLSEAEVYIKPNMMADAETAGTNCTEIEPLSVSGKSIRAVPEAWANEFGSQYYLHLKETSARLPRDEEDWKLRMESQLYETGRRLNVTSFAELKRYIHQELSQGAEITDGCSDGPEHQATAFAGDFGKEAPANGYN